MLSGSAAVAAGKKTVLRMHDEGASVDEIALRFNAHPQVVAKYLREWRKPRSRGKNPVSVRALVRAVETGEVQRMREDGASFPEIARSFGVSHSTVSEKLRTVPQRKDSPSKDHLIPGKRYGNFIFEKVVDGARRKWQFRHRCGWTETFIEPQLREAEFA